MPVIMATTPTTPPMTPWIVVDGDCDPTAPAAVLPIGVGGVDSVVLETTEALVEELVVLFVEEPVVDVDDAEVILGSFVTRTPLPFRITPV